MSRRDALLSQFRDLETRLGLYLHENRTHEIDQATLDLLRDLYGVYSSSGDQVTVPASVNVNLQSRQLTDLPAWGQFGSFVQHVTIHNVLSSDCLKNLGNYGEAGSIARHEVLDLIWRNVKARIAATTMKPRVQNLGRHHYHVWNDLVSLHPHWGLTELQEILGKLESNGVFEQPVHDQRFGIPFTSSTATNPDMLRQWTTDSCMAGLIQRFRSPHLWSRNLITNASFILAPGNLQAALETIRNPEWYRKGDASRGIAHIFLPKRKNFDDEGLRWDEANGVPIIDSVKEDPAWFNRKRLESQALLLYCIVQTIKAGAFLGDPRPELAEHGAIWGFHWLNANPAFPKENEPMTDAQKTLLIKAIQVLAPYLLSVEWNGSCYDFTAPSVSSWEEAPLSGGCASDTGFMVDAMRELHDLLSNPGYDENETVKDVRLRLSTLIVEFPEGIKAESLLAKHLHAQFLSNDTRIAFIDAGHRKLTEMVINPVVSAVDGISMPTPSAVEQFANRGPDSSLLLLAAYHGQFDPSPARSALVRLGIVHFAEQHLMDASLPLRLGMKRYGTFSADGFQIVDSYLNYQFNLGLVVPGLVKPDFARLVGREHSLIADFIEDRQKTGSASPRDMIVHAAYKRFIAADSVHRPVEPKKDASTAQAMADRQQFSLPEWVAQWSIGPTAAIIALARAKAELLQHLVTHKEEHRVFERLDMVEQALTRFINLGVSTVVQNTDANGAAVLRADGTELPQTYNVMESFQVVQDVEGNIVWMAGDHTLPWSASQLRYGLTLAEAAARRQISVLGR